MLTAELAEAVREVAWESRFDLMERRIELLGEIVEDGNIFFEATRSVGNVGKQGTLHGCINTSRRARIQHWLDGC